LISLWGTEANLENTVTLWGRGQESVENRSRAAYQMFYTVERG